MIEWDEINWKQGIATLVLGILLIAGGIFVVDDYLRSQRTAEAIRANLEELNNYAAKYQPPALKDLGPLEAEVQTLESRLAQAQVKLPAGYDAVAIQTEIENRARALMVNLRGVAPQPTTTRGHVVYHPFRVTFSGTREQITDFLRSLDQMPYLHQIESGNISLADEIRVTINLLSFDEDSWLEANPCPELTPLPPVQETQAEKLRLFQGNLLSKQQEVDRKLEELKKAQANVKKLCELNHRLGLARDKLQILNSYGE